MTTLRIRHETTYSFDEPVQYGLQQLRLTPKSTGAQTVKHWRTDITGGARQLFFDDEHNNRVELVAVEPGVDRITIVSEGEVGMSDTSGVHGPHAGYVPLWLFERTTPLTRPGPRCRALLREVDPALGPLEKLHALSHVISGAVEYLVGTSTATSTAEDAAVAGSGVCQDHAHIFLACARAAGIPARYVSGYLKMDDRDQQEATHAWVEGHVEGLGWVGFDVSNAISPDTRYVRVATGLDYLGAAPITGFRFGAPGESLHVALEVRQD
ncbi:transglutaminase family protein [Pseudoroseicyclus aestuarii]|uniref:Transglutaminase-like putative cysteine protease n=1 Tax=Pseudoroseicyclus aestuarii TaxID=1795041 RepID=A0A318SWS0_9RHOB|nr:transglutaminase family protein [Pseudoroseicyclus aestuarii]PYE85952.1 transglutaminase-like putative cysteine protease [Pseudoroseicyclus aestuarii]